MRQRIVAHPGGSLPSPLAFDRVFRTSDLVAKFPPAMEDRCQRDELNLLSTIEGCGSRIIRTRILRERDG